MYRMSVAVIFAIGLASPAMAVQKFIPSGHSGLEVYSNPPRFGTPEADFNLQSDIYETDNYVRQREAKEFDNRLRRFLSEPNTAGSGPIVDY